MAHVTRLSLLVALAAIASRADAVPPVTVAHGAQMSPVHAASVAGTPAPSFIGWPLALPRPEGLRDVSYPFHGPPPLHIGSAACSQACVVEFGVEGDKDRIWLDWLASLPRSGWTVTDERAAQGTLWALIRANAAPNDRFHVALTGTDGGGRGELRRVAPETRAPLSAAPVSCVAVPEPGQRHVHAVAWSFDLDRDGSLDAAALVDTIWVLFEVRGRCARVVGRPDGTLVRVRDEIVGPQGWIDVETDASDDTGHRRRLFEFRRDHYVEATPDAGVR